MVSTALAAAGGALAGSLVTGVVSYYNTRIQQDRQDTRERAGFYIQRKVEILTELHERIAECHSILTPYIPNDEVNVERKVLDQSITENQFEEANQLTREIRNLALKAQLYLTNEEKATAQVGLMTLNYALSEVVNESEVIDVEISKEFQQEAEAMLGDVNEDIELSNYYENIYATLNMIKVEVNGPIEELRQ